MATAVPESDIRQVIAEVKSLIVNQLKEVLRSEGLGAFSNLRKPELQERVIRHLRALAVEPTPQRYERLRTFIYSFGRRQPPPLHFTQTPTPVSYRPPASIPPPALPPPSRPMYPGAIPPSHNLLGSRLLFKESPFYTILEPLTQINECKIRENTRDNVEMRVIFSPAVSNKLQTDRNMRVYLFGAADNGMTPYSRCDVAFPYQVELKVNRDEVKANLRGLKNKPGTTRPADITDHIRKHPPGYPNEVVLTYALTHKKFYLVVNLVQQHSTEELVGQLKQRKTISSEQVIREMRSKAEDADIVATSSVMSLKCPLSQVRIDVPCRTSLCSHNQCFDASTFLQLQQQAPTWVCPVCNKVSSFEGLQIDQYVDNILKSTSSDVEKVTVEPNGDWVELKEDNGLSSRSPPADDDSDLVEITDGPPAVKKETTPAHAHLSTPTQSREQSSVSSATRASNKRPASEVIDLTLSDDEEPPRQRPMYRVPNGHPRYPPSYPPSSTLNHSSSNTPDSNQYSSWYGR